MSRQLKLGALINATGFHIAAWLHPNAPLADATDIDYYARLARSAERGLFDFLFLADSSAIMYGQDREAMSRIALVSHLEPVTLLSALAALTRNVGLVASATTTYNEPFHLARKFASLDHLSKGRAGWNIITSANQAEAGNFSRDEHVAHAQRYARAHEAVEIVEGLWDSWDDDAFLYDRDSGMYFDPTRLHTLGHEGELFRVSGPLNVPRPPQGYPVRLQAGSSDTGQRLGARHADVIFTAQRSLGAAQAFYRGIKDAVAGQGRDPDHVKVLPGIVPFVAATQEAAQAKFDRLQDRIHPSVGLALLRELLGGLDLSGYPLDGPVPDLGSSNAGQSRQALLLQTAREGNLTIRQLYLKAAGARGHHTLIGTPQTIVDEMEQWFRNEGADGFNIIPPYLPDALDDFVELVVPELQRRGLYRTAYEGKTFRENLGLPHPRSRHAAGRA